MEVEQPASGAEDILLQAALAIIDETYPNRDEVIRRAIQVYGRDAIMQVVSLLGQGHRGQSPGLPGPPAAPVPQAAVPPSMAGPPASGIMAAGLMNRGMAGGGHVGGYSGGMDDLVPAVTDGVAPARLSSGEFVIPADVVSHIGDGNNDNGSSKLHDMMNRVRAFKTGNTIQPPMIPDNIIFPT